MGTFMWEVDAAAGCCWVLYEVFDPCKVGAPMVRKAVLTVWDTSPPQLSGRPKYTRNTHLHDLLRVTSELNGGVLPKDIMGAVVTTIELTGDGYED